MEFIKDEEECVGKLYALNAAISCLRKQQTFDGGML
jgi:hypothetical protein